MKQKPITEDIIVVRGGGDLATGTIQKFYRSGMRVLVLEQPAPSMIRTTVSLSTAVYKNIVQVEDMQAILIKEPEQAESVWKHNCIPILVDPEGACIPALRPDGVIDAILAKKNLGTHAAMAPMVIGLGPGFNAPEDVHGVIETMRGHTLGKVILQGAALPNTGIPGVIGDKGAERVLRAPCDGTVQHHSAIGQILTTGSPVFSVGSQMVCAPFDGVLRGLITEGYPVHTGMKTADIDPRTASDCFTISDKARAIGGGALECYLYLRNKENNL